MPAALECVPSNVFLEAGGRQLDVLVKGDGLEQMKDVVLSRPGGKAGEIYARLGPWETGRRGLLLIARGDAAQGVPFQASAVMTSGERQALPLQVVLVPPGDKRATADLQNNEASLQEQVEQAKKKKATTLVVAQDKLPVVTLTVPDPLHVPPDGKPHTLLLKGANLDAITDVRIRPREKPASYRGKAGQLPFRHKEGMLEVDVAATPQTRLGAVYMLDLLVQKFRAASVELPVMQAPAPVLPAESEKYQAPGEQAPVVIDLPSDLVQPQDASRNDESHAP